MPNTFDRVALCLLCALAVSHCGDDDDSDAAGSGGASGRSGSAGSVGASGRSGAGDDGAGGGAAGSSTARAGRGAANSGAAGNSTAGRGTAGETTAGNTASGVDNEGDSGVDDDGGLPGAAGSGGGGSGGTSEEAGSGGAGGSPEEGDQAAIQCLTDAMAGGQTITDCERCLCQTDVCQAQMNAIRGDVNANALVKCSQENSCSDQCCLCGDTCDLGNYGEGPCAAEAKVAAGVAPGSGLEAALTVMEQCAEAGPEDSACARAARLSSCALAQCAAMCPNLPACE